MAEVFIGLGSNLGDSVALLRRAVDGVRRILTVQRVSSIYRTEPVGLRDQPFFLNAVLGGHTELEPAELLAALVDLERAMGRERSVPMGPRTIDLDLLLHDRLVVSVAGLTLPHPRMAERRFVLEPLSEIAPEALHPVLGRTAVELLADVGDRPAVERVVAPDWPPT